MKTLLIILLLSISLSAPITFPRHPIVEKTYPYIISYPGADSIKVVFYYFVRNPNAYYRDQGILKELREPFKRRERHLGENQ